MKNALLIFVSLLVFACRNQINYPSPEIRKKLAEEFLNPPVDAKPHALWCWINGNFDTVKIKQELEEAKANGMGGFDIWDIYPVRDDEKIIPDGEPFMSDKYVDGIVYTINEATRLGLEIGVIASSGWNCGGSWTKPENATMVLYHSNITVQGNSHFADKLAFPAVPPKYFDSPSGGRIIEVDKSGMPTWYKEIAVLAYPVGNDSVIDPEKTVDLSAKMDSSGKLTWDIPEGKWEIVRYVCFPSGQQMMGHTKLSTGPMIDHFSGKAAEAHMMHFINKFQEKLGPLDKTALKYLYSDSYEVHSYEIKNELIWTPDLAEEFNRRIGYDITKYIPALYGFTVKDKETTERFLYDFRKTMSDLICENHYAKGNEVCRKYGIGFNAEAGGPGKPLHDCPFESIKALGSLSAPRGEFWQMELHSPWKFYKKSGQDTNCQVIKGIACAAHLYNKKYVEAESFTTTWVWQEGLYDLKFCVDRAFCEGLNKIYFHTFAHNPRIAGKPGWLYSFGTVVNATQTWWSKSRPFMDYLGRCSYMLQQGNFVADVLYYYGDEAPNFVPFKRYNPQLGYGYDYDYVNTDILLNKISVDAEGKLVLPHGQKYSLLVLPGDKRVNPDVLKKISDLVSGGATVIGTKPVTVYGLKDIEDKEKTIAQLTSELWGKCDGINVKENNFGKGKMICGKTVREVLNEMEILPDLEIEKSAADVDFIHRNIGGVEIYFIQNRKNEPVSFDARFRVSGMQPECWDPIKGSVEKSKIYIAERKQTIVPVDLDAHGSVFVVFAAKGDEPGIDKIGKDGKSLFPLADAARTIKISGNKLIVTQPGHYTVGGNAASVASIPAPVAINGSWNVYFDKSWGGPDSAVFPELIDWLDSKDDRIKYYSGLATYKTNFSIPAGSLNGNALFLDLGEVAVIADISINGKNVGILWNKPFVADITDYVKEGTNSLTIEVANRWVNRLIYDAKLPKEKRLSNCSVTRLPNPFSYPMKELPNDEFKGLLPSGLIGPVKINVYPEIKISEK